jgi:hypothetical protein
MVLELAEEVPLTRPDRRSPPVPLRADGNVEVAHHLPSRLARRAIFNGPLLRGLGQTTSQLPWQREAHSGKVRAIYYCAACLLAWIDPYEKMVA